MRGHGGPATAHRPHLRVDSGITAERQQHRPHRSSVDAIDRLNGDTVGQYEMGCEVTSEGPPTPIAARPAPPRTVARSRRESGRRRKTTEPQRRSPQHASTGGPGRGCRQVHRLGDCGLLGAADVGDRPAGDTGRTQLTGSMVEGDQTQSGSRQRGPDMQTKDRVQCCRIQRLRKQDIHSVALRSCTHHHIVAG